MRGRTSRFYSEYETMVARRCKNVMISVGASSPPPQSVLLTVGTPIEIITFSNGDRPWNRLNQNSD